MGTAYDPNAINHPTTVIRSPDANSFSDEDFLKRYGFTPTEYVARCILSTLHPDPSRWYASDGTPIDTIRYGDLYRQAIVIGWLNGTETWDTLTSALGPEPDRLISQGIADPSGVVDYVVSHA